MSKPLFVIVFVLFLVFGGWMAYQYEADDPGGRAMLESWGSRVARVHHESDLWLSLRTDRGCREWHGLGTAPDRARARRGNPIPSKKPVRFLVEVNEHSSSVGAGTGWRFDDPGAVACLSLKRTRESRHGRWWSRKMARIFGGWAFGNITFRKDGVGLAKPTWFERLLNLAGLIPRPVYSKHRVGRREQNSAELRHIASAGFT